MNDDGSIIKSISWHKINCILIFMPQIHPSVLISKFHDVVDIPFNCCYCISLSSIQSLVNPSNFTFCCRVRVHNATDLHFFLFFIEKSSPFSRLNVNCCYSGLKTHGLLVGMPFRSLSMDCVRFINPIGMSFMFNEFFTLFRTCEQQRQKNFNKNAPKMLSFLIKLISL